MWGRARTFMRSVVKEDDSVGMLLFDEPSASLDPAAEHGECTHMQAFRARTGLIIVCIGCRSVWALAGTEGQQDDGVLVASLRKPDAACRSDSVGAPYFDPIEFDVLTRDVDT